MIRTRTENLKISPVACFPLPSIPLPNTAPAGPVSFCQRRSRNPTLNNRTETRSSFASGRGNRRKRGAASEAPWRSTPSGPWCDRSPGGTPDWDCSSVDSGLRSSDRNDCCRQRKPYVRMVKNQTTHIAKNLIHKETEHFRFQLDILSRMVR